MFAGENDWLGYLFGKRWPNGFICPFCGRQNREQLPAFSVVCRFCRKQTSLTARTLLHGTRKSLLGWLRLCWLFCSSEQGVSAREVKQVLALSSYQSSWSWLQKLRQAASMAEREPCRKTVLVDIGALAEAVPAKNSPALVCFGVELNGENDLPLRFRCRQLSTVKFTAMSASFGVDAAMRQLSRIVAEDATVLLPMDLPERLGNFPLANSCLSAGEKQAQAGRDCLAALDLWLNDRYRRAVDVRYLQGYIDEFTFRWNRRFCRDKVDLFHELVAALVTPLLDLQENRVKLSTRLEGGV